MKVYWGQGDNRHLFLFYKYSAGCHTTISDYSCVSRHANDVVVSHHDGRLINDEVNAGVYAAFNCRAHESMAESMIESMLGCMVDVNETRTRDTNNYTL